MSARTGTATVLFTDLVGSTALRATLGEEGADELRRAHDALLGRCVNAHKGVVIKGGRDAFPCRSVPRRPSSRGGQPQGAVEVYADDVRHRIGWPKATLSAHPDLLIPPTDLSRG